MNFDTSRLDEYTAANGWRRDDMVESLPAEGPGPPEPGGSWELTRRLVMDYQLADPGQVRAVYDDQTAFEGRDMLLQIRFAGLRFGVGVRIGGTYEWIRDVDGRSAQVYGWYYDTLEGHFEQGRMHYEVWKWLDSGEVQFRLHAVSRSAQTGPWVLRDRLSPRGPGQPAAVLSPHLPAGETIHRGPARSRPRVADTRAAVAGPLVTGRVCLTLLPALSPLHAARSRIH